MEAAADNFVVPSASAASDAADPTLGQLLHVSCAVLRQGVDLLDNITANEQLTVHSQYLPGSTIGKHLRHSRDHFELLIDCIKSPPPHILSYDVRIRNAPMEQDRDAARTALLETIKHLEDVIPGADHSTPLTLQAVTPYMQEFGTSFGREVGLLDKSIEEFGDQLLRSCGLRRSTACITGRWLESSLENLLVASSTLPDESDFKLENETRGRLWLHTVNATSPSLRAGGSSRNIALYKYLSVGFRDK